MSVSGDAGGDTEEEVLDNVVELMTRRGESVDNERVFRLLMAERYAKMIDEAHKGYREWILKCHEHGISHAEIAKQTGRSEAAIRMFVSRNRRKT